MESESFDWHTRYLQQARWTQAIRRYLYGLAGLDHARRILEVGCGTGALLPELSETTPASEATAASIATAASKATAAAVHGLDINPAHLAIAASQNRAANRAANRAVFVQGDAHELPYPAAAFDVCLCHFLLLWVRDPQQVVAEMRRVTRRGGSILALAEPCYTGRIDYPEELVLLGRLQSISLQRQGAEPDLGRKLGEIFTREGLDVIETGVLGGQWSRRPSEEEQEMEWKVLAADLAGMLDEAQLTQLRALDSTAWQRGARVLFVPTFYAWGKIP